MAIGVRDFVTRTQTRLPGFLRIDDKIKDIMEGGPPEMLVGNFKRLFGAKIEPTRKAAREAKENLGWPLPGES